MNQNTNQALPTATTTVSELLRMGAKITFGSQRSMRGDPKDGYVHVANEFGSLGLWDLDNEAGVNNAINDLNKDAAESGFSLHGEELPPQE